MTVNTVTPGPLVLAPDIALALPFSTQASGRQSILQAPPRRYNAPNALNFVRKLYAALGAALYLEVRIGSQHNNLNTMFDRPLVTDSTHADSVYYMSRRSIIQDDTYVASAVRAALAFSLAYP